MGFSTKVRNFLWERYLRIDTRVTLPGSKEDGGHYATINYHSIFKILKYLSPKPSDSLVDIGCGKGRVVCCAATAGFGRVAGAEFDQDLANAARGNIQRLRGGHAQANIIQGAAENLSYQDFSVHYHFNPFGAETLKKLLSKLILDLHSDSEMVIVYVFPLHKAQFDELGFGMIEHWKRGNQISEHDVIFYAPPKRK